VKKLLVPFVALILFSACKTNQKVVYLQNAGQQITYNDTAVAPIPDALLKVGDLLTITVNSATPEAAIPFNLPLIPTMGGLNSYSQRNASGGGVGSGTLQNYLINNRGDINFPVIGKIHAVGMTKNELSDYIEKQIYPRYMKEEPIINIRFANFKVSVLGEVTKPGICNIDNEQVSILEAIAQAGDLTIYGRRDNILLIRENNGKRVTVRIDLRDKRLIESPYYYLQQNDILYVQPNNPKSRSSALGVAETLSISVVGTLISLTSLFVTLFKK
jgi:polysaccharide export outer membrane protein